MLPPVGTRSPFNHSCSRHGIERSALRCEVAGHGRDVSHRPAQRPNVTPGNVVVVLMISDRCGRLHTDHVLEVLAIYG